MTLILHIVSEEYQVLVSDGRLSGSSCENFKKQINYQNGFVYYLHEYNKHGWVFDQLCSLRNEQSVIENFDLFRDQIKESVFDKYPDWEIGIGLGFSLNKIHRNYIFGRKEGVLFEREVQLREVVISKPEPCIVESFKQVYIKNFNEECKLPQFNQPFDEAKFRMFFHEFYDTAFHAVKNPDFNTSINICVVRNNRLYNLEQSNTINNI